MPTRPFARPRIVHLLAAAAVLSGGLLACPEAYAQWVWRDANGRVVASDLPPPRDTPERNILQRPKQAMPASADAAKRENPAPGAAQSASAPTAGGLSAAPARAPAQGSAKAPVDPELEKRRKAAEQAQAAQAKADEARLAEQRRENCARARGHLAGLESGQRMARMNEKGEREILDDRARADEIRRAREVIAADCR